MELLIILIMVTVLYYSFRLLARMYAREQLNTYIDDTFETTRDLE